MLFQVCLSDKWIRFFSCKHTASTIIEKVWINKNVFIAQWACRFIQSYTIHHTLDRANVLPLQIGEKCIAHFWRLYISMGMQAHGVGILSAWKVFCESARVFHGSGVTLRCHLSLPSTLLCTYLRVSAFPMPMWPQHFDTHYLRMGFMPIYFITLSLSVLSSPSFWPTGFIK